MADVARVEASQDAGMTTNDGGLADFDTVSDDGVGAEGLPAGTVTFLLSDVEGSTPMWEADREAAGLAIARHYELLDAAIVLHGGVEAAGTR